MPSVAFVHFLRRGAFPLMPPSTRCGSTRHCALRIPQVGSWMHVEKCGWVVRGNEISGAVL
eukprot:1160468-Pelagomonas_calceolata.AAC.11